MIVLHYCQLQNEWESLRRSSISKLVQSSRWKPMKIPIYFASRNMLHYSMTILWSHYLCNLCNLLTISAHILCWTGIYSHRHSRSRSRSQSRSRSRSWPLFFTDVSDHDFFRLGAMNQRFRLYTWSCEWLSCHVMTIPKFCAIFGSF